MGKEQLEIKKESVGQYQEIDIKEEPCFTDVNNPLVEEKLQIKNEPIDNREQDLSFNQDETIVIKEEFSETIVKSEVFLATINENKQSQDWDSCKTLFSNESDSVSMSVSEENNEEKFECSFCNTLYSTKKSLIRHVSSVHEGVKPHQCTKCEAKFASPCYLKAHITSTHESDRPYECVICKSTYKMQQVLNAHMRRVHKIENQQNRRNKQKNDPNETENLSIIEKEDSVEYELPYGWKKVGHHRPRPHGRFMVSWNTRKSISKFGGKFKLGQLQRQKFMGYFFGSLGCS